MNGYRTRSKGGIESVNANPTVFEYPPNEENPARRVITFTRHDLNHLKAPNYLNDTIISFFMQYHLDHKVPAELKDRIHVFNSFFFAKIKSIRAKQKEQDVSYKCASRWLKGVEMFNKDFVIMPVCEKDHWILIILCYPSKRPSSSYKTTPDEKLYEPAVIVLNSWLGFAPSVKKALSKFLRFQWHIERRDIRSFPINCAKPRGMRLLFPKIPQQKNNYNCGVYMLNYFHCFLKDPRQTYLKMFRGRDMTKWFEENSKDVYSGRNPMHEIVKAQIRIWNMPGNRANRTKASREESIASPNLNGSTQTENFDDEEISSDDSIIVIH